MTKSSVGRQANGLSVLEVLRGARRPFDEAYTADVERDSIEDDEASSDSEVSSGTDSDWAVSSGEDDNDFSQSSSIQASTGLAELDMLPSKRPNKEVPQLFYSLKFTITTLYKVPIRRPAPAERLDRWAKASSNEFSLWGYFDFSRLQDVFPQADKELLRRLGRMNTRRRLLLQYRQAHNERLKRDIGDSDEQTSDSKSIQDSYATTFKPPTHDFYSENTKNFEAQSYADSYSSFASTQTGRELPVFPSPPKGPNGEDLEDFICSYCCVTCHITSSSRWERHVLSDLDPYVCTFGNCVRMNDMFQNREDWYNHEIQQHRLQYSCNVKNHQQYYDIRDFKSHMIRDHNFRIDDNQAPSQLSMFSRPTQRKCGVCPLCMKSTEHLKGHLARHLERIALYALPREAENEVDPSDDDVSTASSESIPSSAGARLTESQRLLELGPDNVLSIPSLRSSRTLECPFNFLNCLITFSDVDEWIAHSLNHFNNSSPPKSNICCFCDQTFNCPDGMQSWQERMQHIALHHQLGSKLASARPSFLLYDHLWRNRLISNAEYKNLKGRGVGNTSKLTPEDIEASVGQNIDTQTKIQAPKDESLSRSENSDTTRRADEPGSYSYHRYSYKAKF